VLRGLSWICADVQSRFYRLRGLSSVYLPYDNTICGPASEVRRRTDPAIGIATTGMREHLASLETQPYEMESKGVPGRRRAQKMQLEKYRILSMQLAHVILSKQMIQLDYHIVWS